MSSVVNTLASTRKLIHSSMRSIWYASRTVTVLTIYTRLKSVETHLSLARRRFAMPTLSERARLLPFWAYFRLHTSLIGERLDRFGTRLILLDCLDPTSLRYGSSRLVWDQGFHPRCSEILYSMSKTFSRCSSWSCGMLISSFQSTFNFYESPVCTSCCRAIL